MTTLHHASFDAPLGPASGRYFGQGYKKVSHNLTNLRLDRSNQPGARHQATARLQYPDAWSTKGSRELVPHVSSIDTVALAAALLETAIVHTRDLSNDEAREVWVSRAKVSAGAVPEEDLHHVAVTADIVEVKSQPGGDVATTATFRVGQLRGSMTLHHPSGIGDLTLLGADHVADLAASYPGRELFYLSGYKTHELHACDLSVDTTGQAITATCAVDIGAPDNALSGAETAWPRSVSIIDAILGAAQLSQILLYDLDGVDRASSNTLWMRKLELTASKPPRSSTDPFPAKVDVRRVSTIDRSGQKWRSADLIVRDFAGVTGSCLLAHQLPEQVAT